MKYAQEDVLRDFISIRENTASFKVRARLEQHLLTVLRERGSGALETLLKSLPEFDFKSDDSVTPPESRLVSASTSTTGIVVTTFHSKNVASANVALELLSGEMQTQKSGHREFYKIWKSLLGMAESSLAELDPKRKAVFYIGLLESEVMNRAFGQYLVNTEGAHLTETLECLVKIGAEKTYAILTDARDIGEKADSYLVA